MATKVLRSSVRKVQPGMEIPVDPEGAGQSGLPSFEVTAVGESDAGRSANSDEKEDTPRGPKAACAACRTIKVRCILPGGSPPGSRCVRCSRLELACEWPAQQKRGRKPRARPVESGTGPPPAQPREEPMQEQTMQHSHYGQSAYETAHPFSDPGYNYNDNPLALLAAAVPGSSMAPPAFFPSSSSAGSRPASVSRAAVPGTGLSAGALYRPTVGPSQGPSSGPIEYDTPRHRVAAAASPTNLSLLDVAQAKEAALANLGQTGPSYRPDLHTVAASDLQPDPIDLGILTEPEAEQLFEHFHREMNPFIILFDKHLHTVEFTRTTSTVLFTTLLAVSAKFARPNLYQILRSHAMQLIGRGIVDGRATLGLIQSILCQIYWKEAADSFAWLRIGIAIRMAYQMYLHGQRKTPLPPNEREARMILDRERTWICLIAFDHTYFLLTNGEDDGFHQTTMIPYYRVVIEDWLDETRPYGVTDDLEQGATFEWIKVLRMSKDIATSRPLQARALADHLNGMLSVVSQRYLDPQSPYSLHPDHRALTKVTFYAAAASFALHRALLIAVGTNGVSLANFMVSASAFVEAFENVAQAGYIRFWQDQLGVTMFQFGEFLAKIWPKVYPSNQTSIISWLERVYQACEAAKEGKEDSTAAFISRFIQLCLRVVCSRPTETPAPPVAPPPPRDTEGGHRRSHSVSASANGSGQGQWSPAGTAASLQTPAASTSVPVAAAAAAGGPPTSLNQSHSTEPLVFGGPVATPQGFADPFDPTISLVQTLGGDTAYWESLFPGQASEWSWLDRP